MKFLIAGLIAIGFLAPMARADIMSSPIVINLGEAKAKKSLMAIPPLQYVGAPAASGEYQKVGAEIFNVINNDLTVSSYFQMMPQSAFVEDTSALGLRPAPADPKGFHFPSWSQIGAEFLVRGAFSIAGNELSLEIYVYHVQKMGLVMGKKYKAPVSVARKLAHTFSNDLLAAVTGKTGPFLSSLVVSSDRGGNKWREIYIMDWDGANPEKITNYRSLTMSPAWSHDGSKIAYTAAVQRGRGNPRNHDLFIYDRKTGKATLTSYRPGMNSGASFAPDDKSIYLTISQGYSPDIYKMAYSGDLINKMTNGPNGAMNVEPAASPDGSKIAFSSDRSGKTMIFTMNNDGGNVVRLTHAGQFNSSPSWSPDGKKLAFAGFESNHFDIFVMNIDGTGMVRLTKANKPNGHPANNEDPSFSPDGRFVMYTSDRSGQNQIYISTVDGSEERRVTLDHSNYYKARWSPNLE